MVYEVALKKCMTPRCPENDRVMSGPNIRESGGSCASAAFNKLIVSKYTWARKKVV